MKKFKKCLTAGFMALTLMTGMMTGVAAHAAELNYKNPDITVAYSNNKRISVEKRIISDLGDGKFEVELIINGNTSETALQDADIVLLFDASESMSASEKGEKLKKAAKTFAKEILLKNSSSRIAVMSFNWKTEVQTDFTSSIAEVNRAINQGIHWNGGTHTQDGLRQATELLKNADGNRKRFIVLLTDNEPTFRYALQGEDVIDYDNKSDHKGNKLSGNNASISDFETQAKQAEDNGDYSNIQSFNFNENLRAGNGKDSSCFIKAALVSEISRVKDSGTKLFAVSTNSEKPFFKSFVDGVYGADTIVATENSLLQKLLSDIKLKQTGKTKDIKNGSLSETLSSYVSFTDVEPKFMEKKDKSKLTITDDKRGFEISNLTLGKDERVVLKYQIRLKDEFRNGEFYSISSEMAMRAKFGEESEQYNIDLKVKHGEKTPSFVSPQIIPDDIPRFTIDEVPSPSAPDSPEKFVLVDEDDTPLDVYTKDVGPDGEDIYVDEEGVPLVKKENDPVPKTADRFSKNMIIMLPGLLAFALLGYQYLKKVDENNG